MREFVKGDDLSRRSVERYLEEALFDALDIPGASSQTFAERLRPSLEILRDRLTSQPVTYRCLVTVEGFEARDLPFRVGRIRFVQYGPSLERRLYSHSNGVPGGGARVVRKEASSALAGKVCAVVDAEARDPESAQILARRETRATIDCINFFHDLIPFNHGWLYLPAEAGAVADVTLARSSAGEIRASFSRQGPVGPFSLEQLRRARPVLRYLSLSPTDFGRDRHGRGASLHASEGDRGELDDPGQALRCIERGWH